MRPMSDQETASLLFDECAKLREQVGLLRAALTDCRDAMHEDNPASGWKEIIENANAALETTQ